MMCFALLHVMQLAASAQGCGSCCTKTNLESAEHAEFTNYEHYVNVHKMKTGTGSERTQ